MNGNNAPLIMPGYVFPSAHLRTRSRRDTFSSSARHGHRDTSVSPPILTTVRVGGREEHSTESPLLGPARKLSRLSNTPFDRQDTRALWYDLAGIHSKTVSQPTLSIESTHLTNASLFRKNSPTKRPGEPLPEDGQSPKKLRTSAPFNNTSSTIHKDMPRFTQPTPQLGTQKESANNTQTALQQASIQTQEEAARHQQQKEAQHQEALAQLQQEREDQQKRQREVAAQQQREETLCQQLAQQRFDQERREEEARQQSNNQYAGTQIAFPSPKEAFDAIQSFVGYTPDGKLVDIPRDEYFYLLYRTTQEETARALAYTQSQTAQASHPPATNLELKSPQTSPAGMEVESDDTPAPSPSSSNTMSRMAPSPASPMIPAVQQDPRSTFAKKMEEAQKRIIEGTESAKVYWAPVLNDTTVSRTGFINWLDEKLTNRTGGDFLYLATCTTDGRIQLTLESTKDLTWLRDNREVHGSYDKKEDFILISHLTRTRAELTLEEPCRMLGTILISPVKSDMGPASIVALIAKAVNHTIVPTNFKKLAVGTAVTFQIWRNSDRDEIIGRKIPNERCSLYPADMPPNTTDTCAAVIYARGDPLETKLIANMTKKAAIECRCVQPETISQFIDPLTDVPEQRWLATFRSEMNAQLFFNGFKEYTDMIQSFPRTKITAGILKGKPPTKSNNPTPNVNKENPRNKEDNTRRGRGRGKGNSNTRGNKF